MKSFKFSLYFFSLFLAIPSFAKDYKLTKSEFLSRFDSGSLTLEKAPAVAAHPTMVQKLIDSQKKEFPGFKDEMFYVAYTKSNKYTYFIFFEWYNRGCVYGVTEPDQFKSGSSEAQANKAVAERDSYEKIDKKYCEKALGITLNSSSGLVKIPNAIKPIKPKGK
jgi:hypothetical protein